MKTTAILTMLMLLSPRPAHAEKAQPPESGERSELLFDASEAEAVLSILETRSAGRAVTEADWQRLFESQSYVRLKAREASMHREFTDGDFKTFVLSPELAQEAGSLRRTLDAWGAAGCPAAARAILPYLPDQARVRAKVHP